MSNYYFHKSTFEVNTDPKNGVKVNTPIVLALTPILGALFLMFLPLIGFYLLAEAIVKSSYAKIAPIFDSQPLAGEAYLTGKHGNDKVSGTSTDEKLDDLAKEILSLRK